MLQPCPNKDKDAIRAYYIIQALLVPSWPRRRIQPPLHSARQMSGPRRRFDVGHSLPISKSSQE